MKYQCLFSCCRLLVSVAVFLCLVCLNIVLLLSYSVSWRWPPFWNKHLLIITYFEICNLFSRRRCTSTATSLYWPRRPGRAARQHWQIRRSARFSVSGPNQWNKLPPDIRKVSDKPEQFARALETFYFQTALTSTSEDNIKRRAIANILTKSHHQRHQLKLKRPQTRLKSLKHKR